MSDAANQSRLQIHVPKRKLVFCADYVRPKEEVAAGPGPQRTGGPRNEVEVQAQRALHGISTVCARCERWHEGRERGLETAGVPVCAAPGPCAGLARRMGYPHYRGPMSLLDLQKTCCVCGAAADKSVGTPDGRRVGYCEADFRTAENLLVQFQEQGG